MLKWSFSLFLLIASTLFGQYDFYIKNYQVNIKIDKKNEYFVKEGIDVFFNEPRHGIYRTIPLKFNSQMTKVEDIKTNVPTKAFDKGSYITLRMGDNRYVSGNQKYLIQFKQIIGWDKNKKSDEIYYNIVGIDWNVPIKNVEFEIELPKRVEKNQINFTVGEYGSREKDSVKWYLENNIIKGYITRSLSPREGVTLAIPLEEGYFDFSLKEKMSSLKGYLVYLIYLFIPGMALYFSRKYKDEKVIETVEFYPPDNLTPSELGYYIDGRIDVKDLTSMIFYWANKGYLKVSEIDKEIKLKFEKNKIETDRAFEEYLYDSLRSYSNNNILEISNLKNSFYKNMEKTASLLEVYLAKNRKELYLEKSLRVGRNIQNSVVILILTTVIYGNYTQWIDKNIIILLILGAVITLFLGKRIKKKSEYGKEIYGRVLGFKRFLEVAEKRKLETLLDQNPNYFYDILPYTIVLNVSEKWADKFNELNVKPPVWYESNYGNAFMMGYFMNSFNNTINEFSRNAFSQIQAPSHYGGGYSSSGGGSAGGGAGGGGGGSW